MAYTPLAQVTDLTNTPLAGIVRAFSADEKQNLLMRASRANESYCDRRLSLFTNIKETHQAEDIEPDENVDLGVVMPLDQQGNIGMSYARALDAGQQIRYLRLREFPPRWEDLWSGTSTSVTSITIYRTPAGSQTILGGANQPFVFFPDTGVVRFNVGVFCPPGSTIVTVYSGGYNPSPEDLVQATIWKATEMALLDMAPAQRPNLDISEIRAAIASLLSPYLR